MSDRGDTTVYIDLENFILLTKIAKKHMRPKVTVMKILLEKEAKRLGIKIND